MNKCIWFWFNSIFVNLHILLLFLDFQCVLGSQLSNSSFLIFLALVFSLKVFKKSFGAYFNIIYFHSFNPNTPPSYLFLKLFLYFVFNQRPILNYFFEIWIRDIVPDNTFTNILDIGWRIIVAHELVVLERIIVISVNLINCKTANLNSLHFLGNLHSTKTNFIYFWRIF